MWLVLHHSCPVSTSKEGVRIYKEEEGVEIAIKVVIVIRVVIDNRCGIWSFAVRARYLFLDCCDFCSSFCLNVLCVYCA